MKAVGLITEYNPFHNGHRYHIEKAKEITGANTAVVIMSGNFVQRGAPAIIDKYTRAAIALDNGADFVFELPVSYSLASAEVFARGAIESLAALGFVDCFCFGSEIEDLEEMKELALLLSQEPEEVSALLRENLKKGMSYPKARMAAVLAYQKSPADKAQRLLLAPNALLGLEYLKALHQLGSPMEAFLTRRAGSGYHEKLQNCSSFNSASALRSCLAASEQKEDSLSKLRGNMPETAFQLLEHKFQKSFPITEDDFSSLLYYKLLNEPLERLASYADMNQDLAFRIKKQLGEYEDFSSFAQKIKSRQHTLTRIYRCFFHILLDISEYPDTLPYLRLLGLKKKSSSLLKQKNRLAKLQAAIPVITKPADAITKLPCASLPYWELTIRASLLYNRIVYEKFGTHLKDDYRAPVIVR